ncbi:MAG: hypothetical protein ACRD1C_05345 [Terriglobales bacterium]
MALHQPWPLPGPPPEENDEGLYDETVADSFPASDPPAGVIKLGPRKGLRNLPPKP